MAKKQSDKRKLSIYITEEILEDLHSESIRLDRTLSWLLREAWVLARPQIEELPDVVPNDG